MCWTIKLNIVFFLNQQNKQYTTSIQQRVVCTIAINIYILLPLVRYPYYWNISPRGCRLLSSQCLVPEGVVCSVVNISAQIWFVTYIYYWNLQLLNNVIIIIKSKAFIPQAQALFDFSHFLKSCLVFLMTKIFSCFKIFWQRAHALLINVTPERHDAH